MHALSSSGKPLASWIARDAIQECREVCGGHGYLQGYYFLTISIFTDVVEKFILIIFKDERYILFVRARIILLKRKE